MIHLVLNHENVSSPLPPGTALLDFLRGHRRLNGTKEACRGGDCGACLILLGKLEHGTVHYRPVNSCILPLGETAGKHVVTIEGLNREDLTPIQHAIVEQGAAQCGFCTPGVVLALTAYFLNNAEPDEAAAVAAVDGNLCRCTGYLAIKRAIRQLCLSLRASEDMDLRVPFLVERQVLPAYFLEIPGRLSGLQARHAEMVPGPGEAVVVAGGTDLCLQKPEALQAANGVFLADRDDLRGIRLESQLCHIGAATTIEELQHSPLIHHYWPGIQAQLKLFAATPIRCRATVGGNIVSASPIGDMTIIFLALDATLILSDGNSQRQLALRDFFKGYKQLQKNRNEILKAIRVPLPDKDSSFNFEKVSRRAHLDIASVNSAMQVRLEEKSIREVHLAAGGVAPVPLYLTQTARHLAGKVVSADLVRSAAAVAQSEISPISDVRGSKEYKHLLLRQIIFAHFITLFPDRIDVKALL